MKAEIFNCNGWISETEPKKVHDRGKELLLNSGFKVLDELEHHFSPQGYTCLFLIAESHLAFHTFPEENKTYFELSSCNQSKQKLFEKRFKDYFTLVNDTRK